MRGGRARAVLALAAGTYVVAWAFGSRPLYPLAIGLALAAGAAWVWTRLAAGPMTLRRRAGKGEHLEGDDVWVSLELERRSLLPTGGLTLVESISGLGERRTRLRSLGRHVRGEYVLEALPRGRYDVERAEVLLEDPFGLEQVTVPLDAPGAVVVYPRLVLLESLFSEAGRHAQDGRRLLLRRPSGFDLHSVREYEQGESLRKVHWASTARRGQLMVKELEDAPRDEVVVLLDCHLAAPAGEAARESLDSAVRAAGSIAHSHVRRGRRTVLALNRLRPETHRISSLDGDWRAAMEALAAANADAITPVGAMVGREGGVASRALELAVVTTMLDPQLAHRLLQRAATHRGVSLVWVDAGSWSGRATARDPELARLQAAGCAVAVLRRGDDLRTVLGAPPLARVAGG
jgi:uncharacterized protein (DUF58 family)